MKATWHTLAILGVIATLGCGQSHTQGSDSGPLPVVEDAGSSPEDAAPIPSDAFVPPTACDGLGPAACLDAWCVPTFDDACCPLCGEGGVGCADCTRPTYLGCFAREASPCLGGPGCGLAPAWGCGPAAPDCSTAHVVSLETCDRVGCVPAFPSGDAGEPTTESAICVPITGDSCTVMCRRVQPICPVGTIAEGDGACYTDRCIPAFVCE